MAHASKEADESKVFNVGQQAGDSAESMGQFQSKSQQAETQEMKMAQMKAEGADVQGQTAGEFLPAWKDPPFFLFRPSTD